ncbi:helix-turn-helix domain-containing protein [Aquabacterium sp. J223]|uniref:helix-turn-helix domain-containing protein n=1 Tax=Aquabacterium sp. J223 TaxID=2898431 RepID=UPI0021AD51A7|nr:helix-turn-helix domain-containing protein [Aquabacterium sp. J223]UUX95937.1 helix-turn-helix domain-containing protein [Aquabacterium sp. J223]
MDALIAASARALAAGDALGALQHVALRDDPPALALRGIAMAQLGEHGLARRLLQRARRAFGPREAVARARCLLAEAEVALALRELGGTAAALADAGATLQRHGDAVNALHARLVSARQWLLLGRLADARAVLDTLDAPRLPPTLAAVAALARAEVALRSLRSAEANEALAIAQQAARRSGVPSLMAEVAEARAALERPAARGLRAGRVQTLRLAEVETWLASDALVLDACRRGIARAGAWRSLARRPVLFTLAQALATAWPGDVERDVLIASAFRTRHPDETHRARLRVEIGRLRALLQGLATVDATPRGFALSPTAAGEVVVLLPPIDGGQASLLALLSDGAAWSTSALALALGQSQRSVQRALAELQAGGQMRAMGRARSRRWLAPPLIDFTTVLLLPAVLPGA